MEAQENSWNCKRCNKCGLCETSWDDQHLIQSVKVMGEGSGKNGVMIIGQGLGNDEVEQRRPFIGKAGKELDWCIDAAGSKREDFYITNTVKCRPPGNRVPTDKEFLACKPYLDEEIKRIRPRVLVPAGNSSLSLLTYPSKLAEMGKWRGKRLFHNKYNCWIVPIYHPSALLRERNVFKKQKTAGDLEYAVKKKKKPMPRKVVIYPIIVEKKGEIRHVLQSSYHEVVVAFDTETTGLDPLHDKILGLNLCSNFTTGYYIPWDLIEGDKDAKDLVQKLFLNDKVKVAQNAIFDVRFLKSHGIEVNMDNIFDTMVAHHLIDENAIHGLGANTWRYTDLGGYDAPMKKHYGKKTWTMLPLEVMGVYGAIDAIVTYRLYSLLKKKIESLDLEFLFYKVMMPFLEVLVDVEQTGIKIDIGQLQKVGQLAQSKMQEAGEKATKGKDVNVNSPQQLANYLFDDLKLKSPKETERGGRSTDEEVLLSLKEQGHEVADHLLEYRKWSKIFSTYVKGLLGSVDENDRAHPDYNVIGTVTGRLACRKPSIHTIPKIKAVRGAFITEPGWKLIDADFSQAELRVMAAYSNDEKFKQIFADGDDIHWRVVEEVLGKKRGDPEDRKLVKGIDFGLIYGRGAESLARELGIPVEEAMDKINKFFETYSGVRDWMENQRKIVKKKKFVRNLFGRYRRLPDIDSDNERESGEAERQAINAPIQSMGTADLVYLGMTRVYQAFKKYEMKARIIAQIHDEFLVECPEEEVGRVKGLIIRLCRNFPKMNGIQMEMDVHIMDRWGEDMEGDSHGVEV